MTHEEFIHAVRDAAAGSASVDVAQRAQLLAAKLTYGIGQSGVRGVTYFRGWKYCNNDAVPFVEISAMTEESITQLAGTTIHELAHVLAGHEAGHGEAWRTAASTLGLVRALASGQVYSPSDFDAELWGRLAHLAPADGRPAFAAVGAGRIPYVGLPTATKVRPCPLGYGTRGGKSRGPGSGSRMRLYHCACVPPVKIRSATDTLRAKCLECNQDFTRVVRV
jgi:hypothetical protein